MKKTVVAILFILVASTAIASEMPVDARGAKMQVFAADPAKSQVNAAMTGTITFKKGSGGTVDCTGWLMIQVDPTSDSTYYYNSDTTKTYPLYAGQTNTIVVRQLASGESVSLVLGSATASVQGM